MTAVLDATATAAGLLIAWGGVCRAVKMDAATSALIRWAISAHAAAGLALALLPHVVPEWQVPCLVLAVSSSAAVMVITARAWRGGVPVSYQANPAAAIAQRDQAGAARWGRRESDRMPLGAPEVAPAPWQRQQGAD